MSNTAMSMQELELEAAELLPGRETLCVPSCAPHSFGFNGSFNGVGNTAQNGLLNLSLLNGSPVSLNPLQTDTAGLPVTLKVRLKNGWNPDAIESSPIGRAGQRAVGNTRTSTLFIVSASAAINSVRLRNALM